MAKLTRAEIDRLSEIARQSMAARRAERAAKIAASRAANELRAANDAAFRAELTARRAAAREGEALRRAARKGDEKAIARLSERREEVRQASIERGLFRAQQIREAQTEVTRQTERQRAATLDVAALNRPPPDGGATPIRTYGHRDVDRQDLADLVSQIESQSEDDKVYFEIRIVELEDGRFDVIVTVHYSDS